MLHLELIWGTPINFAMDDNPIIHGNILPSFGISKIGERTGVSMNKRENKEIDKNCNRKFSI